MVIPFVVPEILGGVEPPPQMPLSCQKRQMPLTVKFNWKKSFHFVKYSNDPDEIRLICTTIFISIIQS